MRHDRRQIGIAGAGIGGLTAALALNAIGYKVRVMEARHALPMEGAGIQISPNAFHVLANLADDKIKSPASLGSLLQSVGFAPDRIDLHDGASATPLTQFTLGDTFRERYGAPYLVLGRSDLASLLMNACEARGGIDIQFGASVVEAAQHSRGVTAMVERRDAGGTIRVEESPFFALIGADGVRSRVANLVPGAQPATFTGHIAWRGLVAMEDFPAALPRDATGLWQMPGAHIVHYPVYQGRTANVIIVTPWEGRDGGLADLKDDATVAKAGWLSRKETKIPTEVRAVLAQKSLTAPLISLLDSEGTWGGWPLYAHRRLGTVQYGSIGLIGDAAHAMVPYAAQGGVSAIEDAAVLAKCFSQTPDDAPEALAAYAKQRRPRVSRVMALSQSNRKIYHLSGPMRFARNTVMKLTPPALLERRMDWLYRWRVDA
ncbi:MAG: FAD-dependent monooxygenase [Pseudomonadota bacterium]